MSHCLINQVLKPEDKNILNSFSIDIPILFPEVSNQIKDFFSWSKYFGKKSSSGFIMIYFFLFPSEAMKRKNEYTV